MADSDQPPRGETDPWGGGGDGPGIVELFESLRAKLILFFEVRRCVDPEGLADATLERVVQKLCQGTKVSDIARFTFGVAKHIFQEYLRRQKATQKFAEEQKYHLTANSGDDEEVSAARERRLECLEECMARLKEQERTLLHEYFRFKGQPKLEHRKQLAERLNISRQALTLRVFHLKRKLKKCITDCLESA